VTVVAPLHMPRCTSGPAEVTLVPTAWSRP